MKVAQEMDNAELIEALRQHQMGSLSYTTRRLLQTIESQERQIANLQEACAELEAQIPKEGKWIDAYIGGDLYKRCQRCGTYIEATFFANDYDVNFCPVCGSRMRKGERNG